MPAASPIPTVRILMATLMVAALLLLPRPARFAAAVAGGEGGAGVASAGLSPDAVSAAALPLPPARLSLTGLYAEDGSIDSRNLPFTPQYPLWTDGAAKARWIRLPAGARIDVANVDAWRFPVGTILWKEFAFNGRRVETRMLWQAAPDGWVFATYVWNAEQTDARLAPEEGVPAAAEVAPGRYHAIPGRADCALCHRAAPSVVLGFSALQLSDDRDPLAPHAEPLRPGMVTLGALVDADRFSPPRPEFKLDPPRIRAERPEARAALGYLSGNCGSCHNATGPLAGLGLVLLHDVALERGAAEPAALTTVGAPGRYVIPGVPPDSCRLVTPGVPERSALLHRMNSRRPSNQMPPLGTTLADTAAVRLVSRWIASLTPRAISG